jgi:hypothetical protein
VQFCTFRYKCLFWEQKIASSSRAIQLYCVLSSEGKRAYLLCTGSQIRTLLNVIFTNQTPKLFISSPRFSHNLEILYYLSGMNYCSSLQVAKTRHEGNPKPTPVRKNTLKQPHASPYENIYIASEVGITKQFPSNEKTNTKEVIAANFP